MAEARLFLLANLGEDKPTIAEATECLSRELMTNGKFRGSNGKQQNKHYLRPPMMWPVCLTNHLLLRYGR